MKFPDFIEFDDLNKKVVTMHSEESALRVWDITNYTLLYVIQNDKIDEFKICDGIILIVS